MIQRTLHRIMPYIRAGMFLIAAGGSVGMFLYAQTILTISPFTEIATAERIHMFPALNTLLWWILAASIGIFLLWVGYSWLYAHFFRRPFAEILLADAHTYLPLGVLPLTLSPFNTLWATYFDGLILLAYNGRYLLLCMALLGVYHLKWHNHRNFFPALSRTMTGKYAETPSWKLQVAVLAFSFLVYAGVGGRFSTHLSLGGDEPHYLLITHSLLHDHDFRIGNNYREEDYREFFPSTLDPHVSIATDGTRYSIHPIGMPLLILPGYALGGKQGAILCMNAIAAILAMFLFLAAYSMTRHPGWSLLLWGLTSFTPPLLLYSSQLYPEIPSACFLAVAYYWIHNRKYRHPAYALFLGGILASLPWIQQRMILPAVLLLLYYLWLARKDIFFRRFWNEKRVYWRLAPGIMLAASGLCMAWYYYALFGNPLPNAPYHSVGIFRVFSQEIFFREGALGLLFDQEAGLLLYAPYFLFLFAGLAWLWKHNRPLSLFLFFTIASIYIPCGGFTMRWRGAWSPVSRYMVALIPLFFIPLSVSLTRLRSIFYRYVLAVTMAISLFWSYQFVRDPASSLMRQPGINMTFARVSRLVDVTRFFPSFIPQAEGTVRLTMIWLVGIVIFSIALYISFERALHKSPLRESDRGASQPVVNVFLCYGIVILGASLLSFVKIQHGMTTHLQAAHNDAVSAMLSTIGEPGKISAQQIRRHALLANDMRFEYGSRERTGKAGSGSRFLVTGPEAPFSAGKYVASFDLMLQASTLASENISRELVTIEVVAAKGTAVFSRQTLFNENFSHDNAFERFSLPFELRKAVSNLETRVYYHNMADMTVGKIFIEPVMADFYYNAGMSALEKENREQASSLFRQAIACDPSHRLALYEIALLNQIEQQWENSINILHSVLEISPEFADAHYRLGLAYQHIGHLENAEQHFRRATALLPNHLDAWNAVEHIVRQQNMSDEEVQTIVQTRQHLYAPQYPFAVNFGGKVMFLGYSITDAEQGKLRIEYYWKALAPMRKDYAFFVNFMGETGEKIFQQDHLPQNWSPETGENMPYSTSQWQVGELIHEVFELEVPEEPFTIHLGVWDPVYTKKRLLIQGQEAERKSPDVLEIFLN